MTIVAISAVKTAIGRSRHAAREARAGRCCRSENREMRLATFRDCRGDARRRSASRVGLDATFAARDARDSRNGACGSVGRRGGGRRTSCRTRGHGTGVYDGMSEGDTVMWEMQSVDAQPTSSRSTFSRKLTNDWLSFVAADEFLKSAEIPSEVRFSIISVRFVCDIVRIDPNVSHQSPRKRSVSQQFRPFGVPKGREGLRKLQTRAFCEKSYAHSVPKKPENVDSRLVLTGKIASDRTLTLFRSVGPNAKGFGAQRSRARAQRCRNEADRDFFFSRAAAKTKQKECMRAYVTGCYVFVNHVNVDSSRVSRILSRSRRTGPSTSSPSWFSPRWRRATPGESVRRSRKRRRRA